MTDAAPGHTREIVSFHVPSEPVPFARAGANGKRRFTPSKQAHAMDAIRLHAQRAMAGQQPFEGPVELSVRATYIVPASWSKKRRDAAVWKASKPDADNLGKIVADSLNSIAYHDDAQITSMTVQKVYGLKAGLTVSISQL
jgi:Holliday junction resolvase RusA-like endonuclease